MASTRVLPQLQNPAPNLEAKHQTQAHVITEAGVMGRGASRAYEAPGASARTGSTGTHAPRCSGSSPVHDPVHSWCSHAAKPDSAPHREKNFSRVSGSFQWWFTSLNLKVSCFPRSGDAISTAHAEAEGCHLGRAAKQYCFFKKGLGRRGKGPEKVHIEPATNQTPGALDLEAPSLRGIVWVQLRDLLCSRLSSSKLALWPEPPSKPRVRDRRYGIFNSAAL